MASRLEGIVRSSMAELEGTPAKGKAARIAGKPYAASRARGRALWGDSKPEYADSARQILADWESRQASDAARGFVAEQPSSAGFVADNTGGVEAPPAATNAEAQAAANLFRSVGRGSGPKTTNIATLLAIASGLGAASQTAGAGELPPVEYLAIVAPPFR